MIKRLQTSWLVVIALTLSLAGCNDPGGTTLSSGETVLPPASMLKSPFKDALEPTLYELPSQALITWRDYAKYRPVLVVYSAKMYLNPMSQKNANGIGRLLLDGSPEEILARSSLKNSDPVLLSLQTVSAAIDTGIFSELVFVLSNRQPQEKINLEAFKKSALASGILTNSEASKVDISGGTISGIVRGVPFRIVHPSSLPKIDRPVILHIDLGYFKEMYTNEIKTPVYDLLYQVGNNVRTAAYSALATTLSFSNLEEEVSLESRFLIRDLAEILRNPAFLDGDIPAAWKLRAQILYYNAMFAVEQARELTLQAPQIAPDDAAAHYACALEFFSKGSNDQGFASLDRAVAIDNGYALEYLQLAEQGVNMGRREKAIELLRKAAQVFPNDPFIRLELAMQLIESGRTSESRPIIAELRKLTWSETFHLQIPESLKQMAELAAVDTIVPPSSPPPAAGKAPAKPAGGRMEKFNHMGMGIPGH